MIKIAFLVNKDKKYHIFFSTDINLSALDILDYYSARFQMVTELRCTER